MIKECYCTDHIYYGYVTCSVSYVSQQIYLVSDMCILYRVSLCVFVWYTHYTVCHPACLCDTHIMQSIFVYFCVIYILYRVLPYVFVRNICIQIIPPVAVYVLPCERYMCYTPCIIVCAEYTNTLTVYVIQYWVATNCACPIYYSVIYRVCITYSLVHMCVSKCSSMCDLLSVRCSRCQTFVSFVCICVILLLLILKFRQLVSLCKQLLQFRDRK